jgi:hypothetical protein
MPRFVHITALSEANKIRRNGIAATRLKDWIKGYDRFVWAFPVLGSYTLTHQWSRELKRWGRSALAAVTFEIGDGEPVFCGHYNSPRTPMTAAEATGVILGVGDPRGYEIVIPRRIAAREITGIAELPRAIGWRYAPSVKNKPLWLCDCPVCLPRGEVKAARYRDRVRAKMRRQGRPSNA